MSPTPPGNPFIDLTTPSQPQETPRTPRSSSGPIIGAVIIVLLLVVGGLYFWGAQLNQDTEEPLPLIPGDPVVS